jgi:hypothetical protein
MSTLNPHQTVSFIFMGKKMTQVHYFKVGQMGLVSQFIKAKTMLKTQQVIDQSQ